MTETTSGGRPVGQDSTPFTHLRDLLDVEARASGPVEPDRDGPWFQGCPPTAPTPPVYGGHLVAQALAAAGRTAPDGLHPHSLHAYFLRPAMPGTPIDYHVELASGGRSFAARRVSAWQYGAEVLALTASFHRPEPGLDHHHPMPEHLPEPESLPVYEERLTKIFGQHVEPLGQLYDMRFVGPLGLEAARDPGLRSPRTQVWLRVPGVQQEGGPLLHACVLAYLSDATLMETALTCHGLDWTTQVRGAVSLDHAVWFHRTGGAGGWLLFEQETPAAHGGRHLLQARLFTRDGVLVASVAQEALLRIRT